MSQLRVLILYSNYGDGHRQAARALTEAFQLEVPDSEVILCDLLGETHPFLNEVTKYVYESMFTIGRGWYSYWYYKTKQLKGARNPYLELISLPGKGSLRKVIETVQPDLIISTFPTLSRMAAVLKAQGKCSAPVWTVITDYSFHSNWFHAHCDRYFVPCNSVKDELIQNGIHPSQVHISGIPIRQTFESVLKLNPLPAAKGTLRILVSAGALGVLTDAFSLVSDLCELHREEKPVFIDLVCGRNKRLHKKTRALERHYSNLRVHGYVDHMELLMSSAHLLITKAGGLTVSEALATRLPMLLYRSLPGQEEENAKYMQANGAALIANTPDEVVQHVRTVLESPNRLREMSDAIERIRHSDAANYLVKTAVRECKKLVNH